MKWEYKTVRFRANSPRAMKGFNVTELDDLMNAEGSEGWELISAFDINEVFGATRALVLIFKRPL